MDTGCTDHLVNNKDWMLDFVPCGEHVTNPDGSATEVMGRGTVKCHVVDDKRKPVEVELKEVLCVPGYKSNLLSVKTSAERKAAEFCFGKGAAPIKLSDGTKLPLRSAAGLYMLDASFVEAQPRAHAVEGSANFELWHRRLGHLKAEDVNATVAGCKRARDQKACDVCILGKQSRAPVPKETGNRSDEPLQRVVSDVIGPFDTPSLNGHRWVVTFIDEFSRHVVANFLNRKAEVIDKFKEYLAEVGCLKVLRSDDGSEYTGRQFRQLRIDNKVRQEFTVPETPEQNGIAERFNRTLVEMARCLLIDAKLPKKELLGEGSRNSCPHSKCRFYL